MLTGIGVLSPIGNGRVTFWNALVAGTNGIGVLRAFDTSSFRTHVGGEVDISDLKYAIPHRLWCRLGKATQFALAASELAFTDAGLSLGEVRPERLSIACGSTMGEMQMVEHMDALQVQGDEHWWTSIRGESCLVDTIPTMVARFMKAAGPRAMLMTACAAGNHALEFAMDLIRTDQADVVLAGGVDVLSRLAFSGFNSLLALSPDKCRPFDKQRKGLCLSEGAAMLVVESYEHALSRGARIYAELLSCSLANDAYHMTAPHPGARGAIAAMTKSMGDSGLCAKDIDYVSAHGTGTIANDRIETLALRAVLGKQADTIPVSSIKSMIGHTLGAASAFEAAASALAIYTGVIPPTINYTDHDEACDLDYVPNVARLTRPSTIISNSFAFGGNCTSLILRGVA